MNQKMSKSTTTSPFQLEAKSNEADAKYKTVFREAEARYASFSFTLSLMNTQSDHPLKSRTIHNGVHRTRTTS